MNTIWNVHGMTFPNIYILLIIIYYILYSAINCNCCFGNNSSRFQKPDTFSVIFLQCIMVTSKIKHDFFFDSFYYFEKKKLITSWLKRWKSNKKTLNWFHVLNMLKNFLHLKKCHGCFSTSMKKHIL